MFKKLLYGKHLNSISGLNQISTKACCFNMSDVDTTNSVLVKRCEVALERMKECSGLSVPPLNRVAPEQFVRPMNTLHPSGMNDIYEE